MNLRKQYIVSRMREGGYSDAQIAGVLGNIKQESGTDLEPNREEYSGGGGFGLVQWTGSRRDQLNNFAGDKANTLEGQMDFLLHELNTTESKADQFLRAAQTPEDAAIAFSKHFERPGTPHNERRVAYAQRAAEGIRGMDGELPLKSTWGTGSQSPAPTSSSSPSSESSSLLGAAAAAGLGGGFAGSKGFEQTLKQLSGDFEKSQARILGGELPAVDTNEMVASILKQNEEFGSAAISSLMPGSSPAVEAGTSAVRNSQPLASDGSGEFLTGNSGTSTGPHADVRVYDVEEGGWTDPRPFLDRFTSGGKSLSKQFQQTSPYGMRNHPVHGGQKMHHGIDLATPEGTPVAFAGGEFIGTKYDKGGGGHMGGWKFQGPDGRAYEAWVLHGQG